MLNLRSLRVQVFTGTAIILCLLIILAEASSRRPSPGSRRPKPEDGPKKDRQREDDINNGNCVHEANTCLPEKKTGG